MSAVKRVINLYIHPQEGSIKCMKLDLNAVEEVASRFPEHAHDEARAREIARRIHEVFPKVDVESNWNRIRSVSSHQRCADVFDGIVVHLAGSIANDSAPLPDEKTQKDVERLTRQFKQLGESFQKERQELREKVYRLESENKRLKTLHQNSETTLTTLQNRLQNARDVARRAQLGEQQNSEEVKRITQEYAELLTRSELAQTEHTTLQMRFERIQKELASQRSLLRRSEDQVKALEATNRELEQRSAELEQRLLSASWPQESSLPEQREESDFYL